MIVTAQDGQPSSLERLRRVEAEIENNIRNKISKLHDHKGILFVNWTERPSVQEIAILIEVWGRHEDNPVTYHYAGGVELVGATPRYNPFEGTVHTQLAAIEHLRTARDLLKKHGAREKKNGSRAHIIKRLFQSLKLTESALRHLRRCQAIYIKEESS